LHLRPDCPFPIVLGIDPGTRVVGYGAVVAREPRPRLFGAGVIEPEAGLDVPARLGRILAEFEQLLAEVRPDVVVVEQAFASRNPQSALRIGEGRGVILAAAARFGARIVQFPPAVAKKALVGNGAADKSQVAAMVAAELGLPEPPEPLDASDALALALAHVLRSKQAARQEPARRR
jgi:crossover junction endodeoxyribonuclease RuvC